MAFYALSNTDLAHRIILQDSPYGTYIFVFEHEHSIPPEKDYMQDTLVDAMDRCRRYYEIEPNAWQEIPDNPESLDHYPDLPWE